MAFLIKREKLESCLVGPLSLSFSGYTKKMYSEVWAAFKPGEGALEWIHLAGVLILDLLATSTVRNKLLFQSSSLWYIVMAAWADKPADKQELIFIKY